MISLDALIGVAGCLVTVLVVAGMILLTPRGAVGSHAAASEAEDAKPHPTLTPEPLPGRTVV